tara:strand:- start:2852 stop:3244 length:393 start_codon:yes stop_codon:yes gene_type:complete
MAKFSQSITFSKDNFDSFNCVNKIEYNNIILSDNKIWSTTYKNKIDDKNIKETFNKLHKDGNNIYEKIGNSQNKNSWSIKEFLNTILEKEYDTPYKNNNFKNTLIDAINNIDHMNNDNSIHNYKETDLIK